ncbi:MAG: hypothetical protein K2O94_01570 [Clostridiales bacterium]|nr:hypothetical protein [Clostridiales bacterium]
MDDRDYGFIKDLKEKIKYWSDLLLTLKKWQSIAHGCMKKPETYQKTYPRQGIRFSLKKYKKGNSQIYGLSMGVQGYIGETIIPLECIDIIVAYAEEQLKTVEDKFQNIKIGGCYD